MVMSRDTFLIFSPPKLKSLWNGLS